jgi:hypothetical protein
MNGAVPLLPLYAFAEWTGKTLFFMTKGSSFSPVSAMDARTIQMSLTPLIQEKYVLAPRFIASNC